jgi:hypothetical protein
MSSADRKTLLAWKAILQIVISGPEAVKHFTSEWLQEK